jgi:hypothetical protein
MKALLILAVLILAGCATPRTGTVELQIDADGPWAVRVFEHTTGDTAQSTLHQGDGPQTIVYERPAFIAANAHSDATTITAVDIMADGSRVPVDSGPTAHWWRVPPQSQRINQFGEW